MTAKKKRKSKTAKLALTLGELEDDDSDLETTEAQIEGLVGDVLKGAELEPSQ